jgi:hypothetical protein
VFHGEDLGRLLDVDGGPVAAGYALDAFYTTADVFLLWMTARLVHGEPGRSMARGRSALVLVAAGLGLLYVADLVFTLNYAAGLRHGELLYSRYFGIVPDFAYVAYLACLSAAAQLYPLGPPVFVGEDR